MTERGSRIRSVINLLKRVKMGIEGNMKITMTWLLILSFAPPCFAQGIPCEKSDVEKLKDLDKETLAMTFCDYKSRSDANQEAIRSFEDFSFMEDARLCLEEMFKVKRVYQDRFGEEPPDCGH